MARAADRSDRPVKRFPCPGFYQLTFERLVVPAGFRSPGRQIGSKTNRYPEGQALGESDPVSGTPPLTRAHARPNILIGVRGQDASPATTFGAVMICPDCGAKLDGVPTHQPCPSCGGTRRDALVTASIYVGVVASSPEVEVELDPHRPWYQNWSNTLRALDSLEAAYGRSPAGGNVEVDARVERFFGECNDMRDWLKADKVNLPSLT